MAIKVFNFRTNYRQSTRMERPTLRQCAYPITPDAGVSTLSLARRHITDGDVKSNNLTFRLREEAPPSPLHTDIAPPVAQPNAAPAASVPTPPLEV